MNRSDMLAKLKAVPLFESCSRSELRLIVSQGHERRYEAGQAVCEQGELADDFFVVLTGRAEVRRNGRKISVLAPGDYFGEIALLRTLIERSQRTASVSTVEPMSCFVLGRSQFHNVLYEADVAVKILRAVVKRLAPSSDA